MSDGRRWVSMRWADSDQYRWVTVLAVLGLAVAALMAAAGLPPVDLHGPLHHLGIMDPLCGGTRAARYTIRGDLRLAWTYNPLSIVAVVGAAVFTGRALVGAITGRWLSAAVAWTIPRRRIVVALTVASLVVLEIRQQMLVELLVGPS